MSGYILVVYGAVLPLPATKAVPEDDLIDCLDGGVLDKPYSGNGEAPYWAGVQVASMRQYAWPESGYEVHSFTPTAAQKRKAAKAVEAVPEHIREHMTPVKLYVIPCP